MGAGGSEPPTGDCVLRSFPGSEGTAFAAQGFGGTSSAAPISAQPIGRPCSSLPITCSALSLCTLKSWCAPAFPTCSGLVETAVVEILRFFEPPYQLLDGLGLDSNHQPTRARQVRARDCLIGRGS